MEDAEAVLGFEEEVVVQVLLPDLCVGGGEVAEADCEEVHVQHCYGGPGVEGGCEAKIWIVLSVGSLLSWLQPAS